MYTAITVFNPNNFSEITSACIITFLSMHVLSSFRITVIRYVRGTSAACTNVLSIIIIIGKGKYKKRIYKEEKA
ncbi:hypothetical protein COK59_16245 [Bacillus thuringiensis]|nr:hypothetical protein COK59_16245 [Bacillus thuringiensis]